MDGRRCTLYTKDRAYELFTSILVACAGEKADRLGVFWR